MIRKFTIGVATAVGLLLPVLVPPAAAQDSARIGEVRAFAIARADAGTRRTLYHDGWVEADGRLLPIAEFKPLYQQIGRTWTATHVSEDRFAIPRLRDTSQLAKSYDNPYGVLSPGDLVTSGRVRPVTTRSYPLSYWIFTGQDASGVEIASR